MASFFYGYSSESHLNPILFLQRKFLMMIRFSCKRYHCEDIFISIEISTVFQFHAFEILKFLIRSITQNHGKKYLNDLLCYENSLRSTRRSAQNLLKVPAPKSKPIKQSIKYRGSVLHNAMVSAAVLPENVVTRNSEQIQLYYHKRKSSFILNNGELIKLLLGWSCLYYQLHQNNVGTVISKKNVEIGQFAFLKAVQLFGNF